MGRLVRKSLVSIIIFHSCLHSHRDQLCIMSFEFNLIATFGVCYVALCIYIILNRRKRKPIDASTETCKSPSQVHVEPTRLINPVSMGDIPTWFCLYTRDGHVSKNQLDEFGLNLDLEVTVNPMWNYIHIRGDTHSIRDEIKSFIVESDVISVKWNSRQKEWIIQLDVRVGADRDLIANRLERFLSACMVSKQLYLTGNIQSPLHRERRIAKNEESDLPKRGRPSNASKMTRSPLGRPSKKSK